MERVGGGPPGIAVRLRQSYYANFRPSDSPVGVQEPEAILSVHMVCADTEEEARRQLAPAVVVFRNLARGDINSPLLSPDDAVRELGGLPVIQRYVPGSKVPPRLMGGTPDQVREQLEALAADFNVTLPPGSAPTS